eukprot:gene11276-4089_t
MGLSYSQPETETSINLLTDYKESQIQNEGNIITNFLDSIELFCQRYSSTITVTTTLGSLYFMYKMFPKSTPKKAKLIGEQVSVHWTDIIGSEDAKEALIEAAISPYKYPELYHGLHGSKGILLYGLPGTGKTILAKALATESKSNFFHITSADINDKYFGESEKIIRNLFEIAKENSPSIIFIDEIDSICSDRTMDSKHHVNNIKSELLIQMQGIDDCPGVVVVGATNIPWVIDSGFVRRFQRRIYIPLPNETERKDIFELNLNKFSHSISENELIKLAKFTDGYSGSDISVIVKNSKLKSIREYLFLLDDKNEFEEKLKLNSSNEKHSVCITFNDVIETIKIIKPSISSHQRKLLEEFSKRF